MAWNCRDSDHAGTRGRKIAFVRALACIHSLFVSNIVVRVNPVSMPDLGVGHARAKGKMVWSTIQAVRQLSGTTFR